MSEEEMPCLEALIEVSKKEFTEKIDEWLAYQREKIECVVDEWKEIDNYDNFEEYINDAINGKIIDQEGQPLDLDMIIGLPNMIGDFLKDYARIIRVKHETINNEIDKYYLKNPESIDEMDFGYIKKGEDKITKIKELEEFLNAKPVDNTKTLYI